MVYCRSLLTILALCWLAFFMFPAATGKLQQAFFDSLTHQSHWNTRLSVIICLFVASGLVALVATVGGILVDTVVEFRVGTLLRHNLLAHILERPGYRPFSCSVPDAVSRIRTDVGEVMGSIWWPISVGAQVLVSLIAVALMLSISVPTTLIGLLPLALVAIVIRWSARRVERLQSRNREASVRVSDFISSILANVEAIQVNMAEGAVVGRLEELGEMRRGASVKDRVFEEVVSSLYFNAGQLATGGLLILAGVALRSGSISVGALALFISYLAWISELPFLAGRLFVRYRQAAVWFQRMGELTVDGKPGDLVRPLPEHAGHHPSAHTVWYQGPTQPLRTLAMERVTIRYAGSTSGITDVSFQITRGEFIAITGRVASGKTALLRALLGLVRVERGRLFWNGHAVMDPTRFMIPPRVAYVPQTPHLFSESIRDNVLQGLECSDAAIFDALRIAGLEREIREMSDVLDTQLGRGGLRLSGGQAQRLAVARAVVRKPELLVADDISSALDVRTEAALWNALVGMKIPAIIAVSHRVPILARASTVIVLRDGAVVAQGLYQDLVNDCEELQLLAGTQGP